MIYITCIVIISQSLRLIAFSLSNLCLITSMILSTCNGYRMLIQEFATWPSKFLANTFGQCIKIWRQWWLLLWPKISLLLLSLWWKTNAYVCLGSSLCFACFLRFQFKAWIGFWFRYDIFLLGCMWDLYKVPNVLRFVQLFFQFWFRF